MGCKNPEVLHNCTCGKHSTERVIEQMEDLTKNSFEFLSTATATKNLSSSSKSKVFI